MLYIFNKLWYEMVIKWHLSGVWWMSWHIASLIIVVSLMLSTLALNW